MIDYLDVDGEPMLKFRESMTPKFWRAPTDNDYGASLQKEMRVWKNPQMTLKSFDKNVSKDNVVLTALFDMPEVKAQLMLRYDISAAGEVNVTQKMTTDKEVQVADLFRFGLQLHIQKCQYPLGCIDSWMTKPMEKYRLHYADREFTFKIKAK